MLIALSIPHWPSGPLATDLLATLMATAPRAAISPAEEIAWLDGRGLDAVTLAEKTVNACTSLLGGDPPRAAIARVPIVAAVAVRRSLLPVTMIPAGIERDWLAPQPLAVLSPPPPLPALFLGTGIHRCGELAALDRDTVEVNFGRDGLHCWRLARADDRRLLFRPPPRERFATSLEWTEFSTTDLDQLVFVINAMLGTIAEHLDGQGLGATKLLLSLGLEGGGRIEKEIGSPRSTAQRATWLRLIRRQLEKISLPDRVAGVSLEIAATAPPKVRQGNLFDRSFASAHAAEAAIARVMALQSDAIVRAVRSDHPLPEKQLRWVADLPEITGRADHPELPLTPSLQFQLLPTPREVEVTERNERGTLIPIEYRDNGTRYAVTPAAAPQELSALHSDPLFSRSYHQMSRPDGTPVLLWRDGAAQRWYLAGWWG